MVRQRPHAIAMMMLQGVRNGKTRLLVRAKTAYPTPFYWMNKNGTHKALSRQEREDVFPILVGAGWVSDTMQAIHAPSKWRVLSVFTCVDDDKICRIGTRQFTHCDLLLLVPGMAFRPERWHTPRKELCRTARRLAQITPTIQKTYLGKKRSSYEFKDVRPSSIQLNDIRDICQYEINKEYLKKTLEDPFLSAIVAVRTPEPCEASPRCHWVRKTGSCIVPSARMVWNRLVKADAPGVPDEFDDFKAMLGTLTVQERNQRLCEMLETTRLAPKIGGVCLYDESDTDVRIMIFCSHRSVGGKLLEEMIRRFADYKTLYIDHPLKAVIPFYTKYGFRFHDPTTMIYSTGQSSSSSSSSRRSSRHTSSISSISSGSSGR